MRHSAVVGLPGSILAMRIVLALALVACASIERDQRDPDREIEAQAIDIVWRDAFGMISAPPAIDWWHERCPEHPSDLRAAVVLDGTCYSGLFWPSRFSIDIAWRGSFSSSAFAHEMMHAKMWLDGEPPDVDHESLSWSLAEAANEALDLEGL